MLFLNIEGAFPHVVMSSLLHNLWKRRIPEAYMAFINNILTGHRTKLKFDDYTLEWVKLDNGIGQGNPLSMILYLFYNADMLDVVWKKNELALGYIDDIALVATAKSINQAHQAISDMVTHCHIRAGCSAGQLNTTPCLKPSNPS